MRERLCFVPFLILWMVGLLLLTSCMTEFIHPIPPARPLEPDSAILGEWEMAGKDEKVKLFIYPRNSGRLDLISVEIDVKNRIKLELYEGYTAQIQNERFICLKVRDKTVRREEGEASGYFIVSYKISDQGQFSFRMFDVDKINEMIRKGELRGNIARWKTTVTSEADELVALILKKGVDAFVEDRQEKGLTFSRPNR